MGVSVGMTGCRWAYLCVQGLQPLWELVVCLCANACMCMLAYGSYLQNFCSPPDGMGLRGAFIWDACALERGRWLLTSNPAGRLAAQGPFSDLAVTPVPRDPLSFPAP